MSLMLCLIVLCQKYDLMFDLFYFSINYSHVVMLHVITYLHADIMYRLNGLQLGCNCLYAVCVRVCVWSLV